MSRVVSSRPRSSYRFLPHVVRGGKPAPFRGFIGVCARKCLSPSSHDGESRRLPHDDDREFEWDHLRRFA